MSWRRSKQLAAYSAAASHLPLQLYPNFFQVDAAKIQENTFLFSQMEVYPLPFKPYIDDFNSQPFVPKDPWDLVSILLNFFLRHLHPEACPIKIF